jgi:hypothetical protein
MFQIIRETLETVNTAGTAVAEDESKLEKVPVCHSLRLRRPRKANQLKRSLKIRFKLCFYLIKYRTFIYTVLSWT